MEASEKRNLKRKTDFDKKALILKLCQEIEKRRGIDQKTNEPPNKHVRETSYQHIIEEFKNRTEPEYRILKNGTITAENLRQSYHRHLKKQKNEKKPDSATKCGRQSYFYDWEQLTMMYFLRLCIEHFVFPMKKELANYFNDILRTKGKVKTVSWRYVRYWLRKHGFSYKELRKSNFHQFNSQGFTKKINDYFYELFTAVYSLTAAGLKYTILFEDESGFKDFVSSKGFEDF